MTDPDDAFRREVTEFVLAHCPAEFRAAVAAGRKLSRGIWAPWQRILFARGWAAPGWAKEHGGTGWDYRQQLVFEEVLAENDCPPQYHHGLRHIGPVIIAFGDEAQKRRFLPGILDGSEWWCQGYSEPGAGSDLAALRTTARRDGDDYVVEGHKTWTSHAHESDWMYTLVRTSAEARRQDGISLLLIPLDSPGITIRPIATIDGWHHVNEVFLDGVRVPVANRIGAEGQGWSTGKFLLDRERLAGANVAPMLRELARTRRLVAEELPGDGQRTRREALDARLLACEAELRSARALGQEAVAAAMAGRPLGLLPSVMKLATSHALQRVSEVALDATGGRLGARFRAVAPGTEEEPGPTWVRNYLYGRVRTIYGGSSEVQRNLIARQLFGS